MRPNIHIHPPQTGLDQRRQTLPRRRHRIRLRRHRRFHIEQRLRGPKPFRAKSLVVAGGELKGAAGLGFGEVFVGDAGWAGTVEAAGAGPDLDDGFFEVVEEAGGLEGGEGGVGQG